MIAALVVVAFLFNACVVLTIIGSTSPDRGAAASATATTARPPSARPAFSGGGNPKNLSRDLVR